MTCPNCGEPCARPDGFWACHACHWIEGELSRRAELTQAIDDARKHGLTRSADLLTTVLKGGR